MRKMQKSVVLILGMNGLGVEIAKNIILGGVKSVVICDKNATSLSDLSSQFYIDKSAVGKLTKERACIESLKKLNPYVNVEILEDTLNVEIIKQKQVSVIVLCNLLLDQSTSMNNSLREQGIKFVVADQHGLYGSIFIDNGNEFEVVDTNGKEPATGIISGISNEIYGLVTCLDDARHGLETGDYIVIKEVQGMTELNNSIQSVTVTGPYTFRIDDTSSFGEYRGGGIFTELKMKKKIHFRSLKNSVQDPEFVHSDFSKIEMPPYLHCLHLSLDNFRNKNKRFPHPHCEEESRHVVTEALCLYEKVFSLDPKKSVDNEEEKEKKEKQIREKLFSLARVSSALITPMASIIGGIAAQEVMKSMSGKFMPIKQYFYFDAYECIPRGLPLQEFKHLGCRYDDYIAVFGKKIVEKIKNLRLFLVGAGAIGCEVLKNLAMMGVACGDPQKCGITVTDMDTIEKSNLSRQFLFRNVDVSKLKSKVAGTAIQKMNPDIKIEAHSNRVGTETENIYNEKFWQSQDVVCSALDNIETRLYVDSKCVYNNKPLLESGTLGTKGNTQVIIPNKTESYGSSRDPPEKSVPMCTLKNFPNKIEHTIQWARDLFEVWFHQAPEQANLFLDNKGFSKDFLKNSSEVKEITQNIDSLLGQGKSNTFNDCIKWARAKFEELFFVRIKELLLAFPSDHVTTTGSKFWSGPKRAPKPLVFDISDPLHLDFLTAASSLRARVSRVKPGVCDVETAEKVLATVRLPEFKENKKIKVATTDEELKRMESDDRIEEHELKAFMQRMGRLHVTESVEKLRVEEFEKDDASNGHMDFVTACANLRARNYSIGEESLHKCKLIAGKIIPAIATTTSLVSGLVCLELYKYVLNKPLDNYKNGFCNLAIPFFAFSEPLPPKKVKSQIEGKKWEYTIWDKIDVREGNLTLKQFIGHFKRKLKLNVNVLASGPSILYSPMFKLQNDSDMEKPLCETVEKVRRKKLREDESHVLLEAMVNDLEGNAVEIPSVRMYFR